MAARTRTVTNPCVITGLPPTHPPRPPLTSIFPCKLKSPHLGQFIGRWLSPRAVPGLVVEHPFRRWRDNLSHLSLITIFVISSNLDCNNTNLLMYSCLSVKSPRDRSPKKDNSSKWLLDWQINQLTPITDRQSEAISFRRMARPFNGLLFCWILFSCVTVQNEIDIA